MRLFDHSVEQVSLWPTLAKDNGVQDALVAMIDDNFEIVFVKTKKPQ